MWTRLKEWWVHRHDPSDPAIHVESDGFWYEQSTGKLLRFPWSEIREIRAYKIDLLTVDEVRFAIQMEGWWASVSEEQPGFGDLVNELEKRFPTVVGWQAKVIKPAFARNETVLYEKTV